MEKELKEIVVPVSWTMTGYIKVKATSIEAAQSYLEEHLDECPIPSNSNYLEDTYEVEHNSNIIETYTDMYSSGKMFSIPEDTGIVVKD